MNASQLGSGIKSIQRGTISILGTVASNTATITAVDMAKTELRTLGWWTTSGTTPPVAPIGLVLTNTTTITANRGYVPGGGGDVTAVSWELTERY